MGLRRRRPTLRYDQLPRQPRRGQRTFALIGAGAGAAIVAWLIFAAIVLRH